MSCGDKGIHHNIMAEASGHNKEMENLVGTEVFVAGIEKRKLQSVNGAADGVNDTASQKSAKSCRAQGT